MGWTIRLHKTTNKQIHRGSIKLPYVCCVCISMSYSYRKKGGLNDPSLLL